VHDPFHDPYGDLHDHDADHFGTDIDHSTGHVWVDHHPDASGSNMWEFHDHGAQQNLVHHDELGTHDHSVPPFGTHGAAGEGMFEAAGPATMGWTRAFDALGMTDADAHPHGAAESDARIGESGNDGEMHVDDSDHGHGGGVSAPRFGMAWDGPDTADGHKTVISTAEDAGGLKYDTVTGKQLD
jgi:hypothetical protein